jgi:hypothetical protein
MCFDIHTSLTTFTIGTAANIFNVYKFSKTNPEIIPMSLAWQWTLMMQIFEAMAWNSQDSPDANQTSAGLAMMANVTQPIFVLMVLLATMKDIPVTYKQVSLLITFVYVCWLTFQINKIDTIKDLKPKEDCGHLDLNWWRKFDGKYIPYLITLFTVMILLLRPLGFMTLNVIYIAATLLLSRFVYTCGSGSMWCWFATFAPIVLGIYLYTS